jgi:hypothetical protein
LLTFNFSDFLLVLSLSLTIHTINSEDYYGDLDIKSIRKSELLAGLANPDNRGANAGSAKTKKNKE